MSDSAGEETEAQIEGRILGLSDEEIGWLNTARIACVRLNELLEQRSAAERWNVLGNSDPRRRKREHKL